MSIVYIPVKCTNPNCDEGKRMKKYKEYKTQKNGELVLVDYETVERLSYSPTKEQLKNMTIAEFIADTPCRKCRSKKLKEVVE